MATKFEEDLRDVLEGNPDLGRKGKRILEILNNTEPHLAKLRKQRIAKWEKHVKIEYSVNGEIDWASFLGKIIELILKLIPIFGVL